MNFSFARDAAGFGQRVTFVPPEHTDAKELFRRISRQLGSRGRLHDAAAQTYLVTHQDLWDIARDAVDHVRRRRGTWKKHSAVSVLPAMPTPAEPATTVSTTVPELSTPTGSSPRKPRAATTARFLTRDSVTEVNWIHAKGESVATSSGRAVLTKPLIAERVRPSAAAEPGDGPLDGDGDGGIAPTAGGPITSFPALRKRHCTNDWIVPPVCIDMLEPRAMDLYALGVDAHVGAGFTQVAAVDEPRKSPICDASLFRAGYIWSAPESPEAGSIAMPSSDAEGRPSRLGSAVGSATGLRRSSTQTLDDPRTLLALLREKSAWLRQTLGMPAPASACWPATIPEQAWVKPSSESSGRPSVFPGVRHQGNEPSHFAKATHPGTWPTATRPKGDSRRVFSLGHGTGASSPDTCSEDGNPHFCAAEL